MEPLSQYWAETREKLHEMAIERGLTFAPGVFVDVDELVCLLQKDDDEFKHQYDKHTIKDLKVIAKSCGLMNFDKSKAELIEFLVKPPLTQWTQVDERRLWMKARRNKSRWDKFYQDRPKPKFYKVGFVKKPINYSPDVDSWKQCEGKVQGRKCKNWDKVSVEVMISKKKYICQDCINNKTKK